VSSMKYGWMHVGRCCVFNEIWLDACRSLLYLERNVCERFNDYIMLT
jgi:hypothetical protein